MDTTTSRLASVLVSFSALLLLPSMTQAAPKAKGCSWFPLVDPPAWTISGIWTTAGDLMLADANKNRLLEYSPLDGRELRTLQSLTNESSDSFRPSSLQKTEDGFAVLENSGRISWIGSDFTTTKRANLTAATNSRGQRIGSVFSWALGGNSILTFSDLENLNHTWSSSFLRIPTSNPEGFTEIDLPPLDDEGRDLYLYGHPYIAASPKVGYILLMQAEPAIFAFDLSGPPKAHKLNLRGLLGSRPILPKKEGIGTVRTLYAAVEKSSMPVGIYFYGDRLFLLYRQPRQHGTKWSFHRIDPSTSHIEASFEVLSSANHLAVVPGPSTWAFVEKGPVLGLGKQVVSGVLTIPSEVLLKEPSGRLCAAVR